MTAETLIHPNQNPKGRRAIQTDHYLYVFSECCDKGIDDHQIISVIRAGVQVEEQWMLCSKCHRTLSHNPRGFTSKIVLANYAGMGYLDWALWGKYMFGYDDFEMEITV